MNQRRPIIDRLESRRMLSVSLSGGVLTVAGHANAANAITVGLNAGGGRVTVDDNGTSSSFEKSKVRRVIVEGGAEADVLTADDANGAVPVKVRFFGHAGADTIAAGNGTRFVSAGAGADTVTAGRGRDTIFGGGGDDSITLGNGNNTVFGGPDNDTITTGNGTDTVFCLAGNDVVHTGGGDDTVFAAHADTVDAGAGNNLIFMPYADDATVNNAGGGTDAIRHRKLANLRAFRTAFIELLGLKRALAREL